VEARIMMEGVVALLAVSSLIVGPVVWSLWSDRARERSLAIRAEIQSVVNHALGGESLVTIEVVPAMAWRRGRVVLCAPADWRWLIDSVWMRVLDRLPENYELVVRAGRVPAPAATRASELKRAA
jgi:hypothetical protein